jgi:N-acetylmuramoyl-L-alanine amidase
LRLFSFLRYFNNLLIRNLQIHRILPVILLFFLPGNAFHAQKRTMLRTVVIDAGHGGHDPGAMGRKAKEKNINLSIALKLGNLIQRNFKDVRVIYTRDKDFFVELFRRAEIANENKADLFICIHCNANPSKSLKGTETYVMGLHKSQANLNIAKQENAAILLENDYQAVYDGFDPNSDESYIAFSLYQNANLDQSSDFASLIQSQMEERVGMNNRGVRQAGFIVLYRTTMPSVLVETGYLSNPSEENFLSSDKGQEYIASAIYRAFRQYKQTLDSPGLTKESDTGADPSSNVPGREPAMVVRSYDEPSTVTPAEKKKTKNTNADGLSFRVQIAVASQELPLNSSRFSGFPYPKMYRHSGLYKYTVGDESTLVSANRLLAEVKRKGVKDAFVVIFRNNERIPQEEANRIQGTPKH